MVFRLDALGPVRIQQNMEYATDERNEPATPTHSDEDIPGLSREGTGSVIISWRV